MQSIEVKDLQDVIKRFATAPEAVRKAQQQFFAETGNQLLTCVRGRIGGDGTIGEVQERYIGCYGGYVAVRAKANTNIRYERKDGTKGKPYAAGYVTNSLENGHIGRGGVVIVAGKYMYKLTQKHDAVAAAERGAEIIGKALANHLEGRA